MGRFQAGVAFLARVLSSDNRGGMKRRDKEIRKQPSGDPSSGENSGILLQYMPRERLDCCITARVSPLGNTYTSKHAHA